MPAFLSKKELRKNYKILRNALFWVIVLKVYWSGGTPTPSQKNLIADLDEF